MSTRKSTRENIGRPPKRFSPSASGAREANVVNGSLISRASAIRLREIEVERLEAIAKIEEERLEREKKVEEERLEREKKIEEERLAREKKIDEERIERQKQIIEAKAALQRSKVLTVSSDLEEEQDDRRLLDVDECEDNTRKVQDWLEADGASIPGATIGLEREMKELSRSMQNLVQHFHPKPTNDGDVSKLLTRQALSKDLPTFDGRAQDWPLFIAAFKRTTQVCGFSDDENLARLQRNLKGEALESVASLFISSANVEKIIKTLTARFGNPDMVVQTMLMKTRELPNVKDDKPLQLIKYSNAMQNLVAVIESLKLIPYLMNPQLLDECTMKLSPTLRYQWAKNVQQKQIRLPTISDFSSWLEGEASALSIFLKSSSELTDTKRRDNRRDSVMVAVDKTCEFCAGLTHNIQNCMKFVDLDINARWNWVKENKKCFICFGGSHRATRCREKRRCEECSGWHNRLLHYSKIGGATREQWTRRGDEAPLNSGKNKIVNSSGNDNDANAILNTVQRNETREILFKIIPVKLLGPKTDTITYAFLDEGSSVTLIEEATASIIGLEGSKCRLNIQWMTEGCRQELPSRKVDLQISGVDSNENPFQLKGVKTIHKLNLPCQKIDGKKMRQWKHIQDLDLNIPYVPPYARPTILIGQDNCDLIVSREVVQGPPNAPMVSRTNLGWVVHGNLGIFQGRSDDFVLHLNVDEKMHDMIVEYMKIDSIGIALNTQSKQDSRAEKILEETSRRIEKRWETGLLWRRDDNQLPSSKGQAMRRLFAIEKKMDKDQDFAREYEAKFADYESKGYIRRLTEDEAKQTTSRTWYLPHFAVYNPNKPGKLRLVIDAAAKSQGQSLNDNLLPGPDLLNPLTSVLFKFREKKVAFGGDIKEMFHQISIRKKDQCAQRLLWRENDKKSPPSVFEMQVMTFGAVCSPCSAQYIKNRNAKEFQDELPDIVEAITNRHYVDDYLDSEDSVEKARQKIRGVLEVHQKGGFEMREWISNVPEALNEIPAELQSNKMKTWMSSEHQSTQRVLGLNWCPADDNFLYEYKFGNYEYFLNGKNSPTKRQCLKSIMSVFDPLGFLAHLQIKAKIMLQEIWRLGIGWDDEITGEELEKWVKWCDSIAAIPQIKIPRYYSFMLANETSNVQLHIFCDASKEAYAAVAYFRIENNDEVDTAFIMAKARVAPLKPITIPRLELQAALIGSRLATTIRQQHTVTITMTVFWSDSKTVLAWIRDEGKRYNAFVAHRVGEIQESTDSVSWKWVPTKENIADIATRSGKENMQDPRWLKGPEFLLLPERMWPQEILQTESDFADECKEEDTIYIIVERGEALPDIERFSKWTRLIRSTAWVLRVVEKYYRRSDGGELKHEELQAAENLWVIQSQNDSFTKELKFLKEGKPIPKTSRIYGLSPIIEQGLIRLKGRLTKAMVPESLKRPIILDPKHKYTKLLIQHYHEKIGHHGREMLANELRRKFWILRGRVAIRNSWNTCRRCANERARPVPPEMGDLPSCRLTPYVRPFTFTGMDYFGPMEVTIGRRREKRYGVLFTCLTTRAVHLEIAASLTTDSTIMAIRRMISRRGNPKEIYSDNGTNLRGADMELRRAVAGFNEDVITTELAMKMITWKFIPPGSPHMGGSWERLVRSVKIDLKTVLKDRAPKEETLQTLMTEVEHTVNTRPLTNVSNDPHDGDSLTPNHFLIGPDCTVLPFAKITQHEVFTRKQWRLAQLLADHFWKRWLKEYLPTLSRRKTWLEKAPPIIPGEVVILADSNLPRNVWPKGIVTKTYPGTDGQTRVVELKTALGTYLRPATKIIRLSSSN